MIDAKGRDSRSTGNASALVTAQLRPDGDRTLVSVDTDLKISGKLAQFGSGMIKEVSGKLLAQFVANLEAKLAAEQTTPAAEDAAPVPAARSNPSLPRARPPAAGPSSTRPRPPRRRPPRRPPSGPPLPGPRPLPTGPRRPPSRRHSIWSASPVVRSPNDSYRCSWVSWWSAR
ncbi:hypothetical protein GCM10027614_03030 [Micromonospora vulcania]